MISWTILRVCGNSQVVKSNYIWIFIIPIVAKIFSFIQGNYHLNLELPLRLESLFYSSLFFAVGAIIYQVRCPKLIKEFEYYSDFKNKGLGMQQLADLFSHAAVQPLSKIDKSFLLDLIKRHDESKSVDGRPTVQVKVNHERTSVFYDEPKTGDFYWEVTKYLDSQFCIARYLSFISFLIGITFLLYTVIENLFKTILFLHFS